MRERKRRDFRIVLPVALLAAIGVVLFLWAALP